MALSSTCHDKPYLCLQCGGIFTTVSALTEHNESEHGQIIYDIHEYILKKEGAFEAQLKEEPVEIPAIEQLKNINKEPTNTSSAFSKNKDIAYNSQVENQIMGPWNQLLESYKVKIPHTGDTCSLDRCG